MFAQLGKIIFQTLYSFTEDSEKGSAVYAEHQLLDGKPRLQLTGSSLNERSVKILLNSSFCVPQDELDKLKLSRDNGEVMPLIWGNGRVEGDFVIVDIDANKEDVAPNGTVITYSISLALKEYVSPNKLQSEQADNRNKAKAVGNKKPVAKKKINKTTCPQIITRIVSSITNHYKEISAIVLERGGMVTLENKNSVIGHLKAMRLLCDDLIKKCDDPSSCAHPYPDLRYRSTQVQLAIDEWNDDITSRGAIVGQIPRNKILGANVRNLNTAAQPLVSQTITRKG